MNNITRRQALGTCGLAFAAPLAISFTSTTAWGKNQETQNGGRGTLAPIDPKLCKSVLDQSLATWVHLRNRQIEERHLAELALSVELLANHFTDTGLDPALRKVAAGLDARVLGKVPPPHLDKFVEYCRTFDTSVTESSVWTPRSDISIADATAAMNAFISNGPSSMLHDTAAHLRTLARSTRRPSAGLQSHSKAHLVSAVYPSSLAAEAHLEYVQEGGTCGCTIWDRLLGPCPPPAWCDNLNLAWGALSAAVAAVVQQCAQNPEAWEFCGALATEIALLGLAVADILSWGAIAIGLILLIICT